MRRGNRFFLCISSRNCIVFIVIINAIVYIVVMMICQNHQLIVTSLDCCWYSGGAPRVLIVGVPATPVEKWVQDGWRMISVSLLKMYVSMTFLFYLFFLFNSLF